MNAIEKTALSKFPVRKKIVAKRLLAPRSIYVAAMLVCVKKIMYACKTRNLAIFRYTQSFPDIH